MTILEKIKTNDSDCLHNPSLLSEYLVKLTGSILDAEALKFAAEIKYAEKWNELRKSVESDKQCDMKMKLDPTYLEMKSKEALARNLLEVIRSVKKRLVFLSINLNEFPNA